MRPLYICIWNGLVIGNGVSISINAPIRIATEKTRLSMPESKIGFFPDGALTWHFARLRNNIGVYLGISGLSLAGRDLVNVGLANYYVESKNLSDLENDIKEFVSNRQHNQVTLAELDKHVLSKYNIPIDPSEKIPNEDLINDLFQPKNSIEDIISSLETHQNTHREFCQTILQEVKKFSPLSLKVAMEKLQRYSPEGNIDKVQAMKEDLYTGLKFMNTHEFNEGSRCLVVDKDCSPNWKFKLLQEINQKEVDEFVYPKGNNHKSYFL